MINETFISKVCSIVKNDRMLDILARYLIHSSSDTTITRFIEMCLCSNEELKVFIKNKDDFNRMSILVLIDSLKSNQCIIDIVDIYKIDYLSGRITVKYKYNPVTYHEQEDFSDEGMTWKRDDHKYVNIHSDEVCEDCIVLNYYTNSEILL